MKSMNRMGVLTLISSVSLIASAGQSCKPTPASEAKNADRPCTWVLVDGGCKCDLPDGVAVSVLARKPAEVIKITGGSSGVNNMPTNPIDKFSMDAEKLNVPDVKKPSSNTVLLAEEEARVQLLTPEQYKNVYTKIKIQPDGKVDLKIVNDELMKSGVAGKDAVKVIVPVGAIGR